MKSDKILRLAIIVATVIFVAGATIGTLAIPVILAMTYSWYWLFLYAGYLLVILYVALYFLNYAYDSNAKRNGGIYK